MSFRLVVPTPGSGESYQPSSAIFSIREQALLPSRKRCNLDRSYSFLDYNRIYGSTYVSEPKNGWHVYP